MDSTGTNGNFALTRLVWWAIGTGAFIVIGAGSFFATGYLRNMETRITVAVSGMELRTERVNVLEGRVATLENTGTIRLDEIARKLDRMEAWQEQVRQDLADLKAAIPKKP